MRIRKNNLSNYLEVGLKQAGCSLSEVAGIVQKAEGIFSFPALEYVEAAITLADAPEMWVVKSHNTA